MSHDPIQHYQELYQARPKSNEPTWLRSLREAAFARFTALGFPTRKHEEWKYTPVRTLTATPFASSTSPTSLSSPATARTLSKTLQGALRVVIVDGHIIPSMSALESAPAGVSIRSLREMLHEEGAQHDLLRQRLSLALDRVGDNAFDALNLALFMDGVVIDVPKNIQMTQPIEILYVGSASKSPQIGTVRSIVSIGQSSQASIVERFVGAEPSDGSAQDAPSYFTSASTSFFVEDNAALDHYKIQQDDASAFHIAWTWLHQKSHSRASSLAVSLGAKIARNETEALLDGQGIETTLNGLYLVDGERFVDNRTFLDHAKPHCNSFEVYKGILSERGKGTFNGKILVRQDAQKTDAKQSNQALLLSDDATIYSKPQLEIFADDVKCTHGATTGYLDAKSMFYARSRGIPEETARGLLTYAFANAVIEGIRLPALQEELGELLMKRFHLPAVDDLSSLTDDKEPV